MWRFSTYIAAGGVFAALSALLYFVHYIIFEDPHHISIFMVSDLAFVPLEVFLVVIVIERVLARREKRAIREKMNMVVGAFFSEIGNRLLQELLPCLPKGSEISERLSVKPDWGRADFQKAMAYADRLELRPDCRLLDLEGLKALLVQKRQFLVGLLESPNILEREHFTDLLWATLHLDEELEARPSLTGLPAADMDHISADIQRLYSRLVVEWMSYVEYLKASYPFLFSLAARTHPFQERPSAIISQ